MLFKSYSVLLTACGSSAIMAMNCGSLVHADNVYNDTFARTGNLAGSTPSPTDTGNVAWGTLLRTDVTAATNGSALLLSQSTGSYAAGNGYLTYTPPSSGVLTLSASLAVTDVSNGWGILGFESTTTEHPNPAGMGPNVMLISQNKELEINPVNQQGTGTEYYKIPSFSYGTGYTLTITYDIGTETAKWYIGSGTNQTLLDTYDYLTNGIVAPSIVAVETGLYGATNNPTGVVVTVQNFELDSVAVPAPASLGLVAIGGLGLLLLKRRRA